MDKKINDFVFNRNFILKKKLHLFVDHHNEIGNHFSVVGMLSSKAWATSRWLTGAVRVLGSLCSSSRFSIFVEDAKCAALLIEISLA